MSETTLCKQYGDYCSNAGIYVGGGFDLGSSLIGGVAQQTVNATINGFRGVYKAFNDEVEKAARSGALNSKKALSSMARTLEKMNEKALQTVDSSGQYVASKLAKVMLGGVEQSLEIYDSYYGGGHGVDPIITHGNYLVDSYEFLGGATEEVLKHLEPRLAAFEMYLTELKDVAKRMSEIKGADKEKLKYMIEEQYNFIKKAHDEFSKIRGLIGPVSDISKKIEELAKHGKVKELKELLKSKDVNKDLVEDYILLLRSQGHMGMRAEDINNAIKTIGMTMEQFKKLDSIDKIEDALAVYEKELFKKHGKDKSKFYNALHKVKQLALGQIGSYDGGVCPCSNSDDSVYNFDEHMLQGGFEDYFGGEFLGLEKEVEYEALTNKTIDENDLLKRAFLKGQAQHIAKMLQAAQKAAFEVSSKGNFDDNSILLFLFRLKNLHSVKTDDLVRIFATHGKDYNSDYMRKSIINDLEDIAEAARAIESKIGPAMKDFAASIDDYKKFLNKSFEENRGSAKMMGGDVNCSGINIGSIYDRFVGGDIDLTIDEVISAFNDSILIGRMKNGLNLSLEDLGKFSIEQDKVNESVLSKLSNQINASANEMISKYKEESTFPVKKQLFEIVLRNNVRGQVALQHAAQAMDKKIRMYQKHIIADPLAAKEVADLLSKVTIDTNWMPDQDFEEFKNFCDYFHIESVAKNTNRYTQANVQEAYMLNGTNPLVAHNRAAVNNAAYPADGKLKKLVPAGAARQIGADGDLAAAIRNNRGAAYLIHQDVPTVTYNFRFDQYNNDYIKQDLHSPLPISSEHCLEYSVPTLILATKDGKFNPKVDKQKLKQDNSGRKKAVNLYDGIDVFPAKAYPDDYTGTEGYNIIDSVNCTVNPNGKKRGAGQDDGYDQDIIPTAIFNPVLLPRQLKFISEDQRMKNYFSALKHAEDGANMLLNLRNLFSIFESIDDIYKKKSGASDDGVKIGQIYGAVKQYLILTCMYPVIYKHDDGYKCGFIAMRHFGHDVVVPFEETEDIRHGNAASCLLGDLAKYDLSLREFESGRDFAFADIANKQDPFPRHDNNTINNDGFITAYSARYAHEFRARYARFDLLLTMMIKSMYAKVMSVLAMYNLVTFKGQSGDEMDNNLSFAQLRTIYGGDIDSEVNKGIYSYIPEVRVECVELYIRLYYYIIFYKKLFMEETSSKVIEQVIALKRFALLPTNDSKFSEIIKLFFLKKFNDVGDKIFVNDTDLVTYISECNKLYDSESGSEKSRFEKIIKDFIRDINQRYGLVKTDSILEVMNKRHDREYPGVKRMNSRQDYMENSELIKRKRRDTYVKNSLLDGEDSPIGNLGAPSARNESVNYSTSNIESIITPVKSEYRSEELLASVYNFRRKLDDMTKDLTKLFDDNNKHDTKKSYTESLFSHINSLKQKLIVRSDNMSKFRVLKEYVNDFSGSKIFNIPVEVNLYRELVVNSMNLLYKIYVRIIANLRIYGIENEWTEPLLRGTYLYYLDSINTDLVKVNRLGKSPVLDFSTLQTVLDRFLGQTREFYLQLSSGVAREFNTKVDKALTSLLNIHRSIFKSGGLVDSIQYEDKTANGYTKSGVKLAAINDYSEYQHLAYIENAIEGQNSFVLDQMITRYPDPVTARDPRSNVLKEALPELEFELLSKHFSPKNIYVMFEYLLVNIYKIFFERNGVFYGPLMEEFVNSLSHIDIGIDLSKASGVELGGVEYFEDDMPFSTKVVALYKAIYKFNINSTRASVKLTENDLSLMTVESKESMKKYLPIYLMLFKFIIKQAYLHLGMTSDGAIYKATDETRPDNGILPQGDGNALKEIVGAAGFSKADIINQIINNSETLIKQASKSKTVFTSGIDASGLSSKVLYEGLQSNAGVNGIKSNLLLGAYVKGDPVSKDQKESDVFSKFSKLVRSIASGSISKEPSLYDDFMNLRSEIDKFNIGLTRLENVEGFKDFLEDTYKLLDHDHSDPGSQFNRIKSIVNDAIINNKPEFIVTKHYDQISNHVKTLFNMNEKWNNPATINGINDAQVLAEADADAILLGFNLGLPPGTAKATTVDKIKELINKDINDDKYNEEYIMLSNIVQILGLRYKNSAGDINEKNIIETAIKNKPRLYLNKNRFKNSNYKNVHTLLSLIIKDKSNNSNVIEFATSIKNQLEICSQPNGIIKENDFRSKSAVLHGTDDVFKNLNKKCNDIISGIFTECGNYIGGYYYVTDSCLDIIKTGKGLESYNKFVSFFIENYCEQGFYVKYAGGTPVKTAEYEKYEQYSDTYFDLFTIDDILKNVATAGLKPEIKNLISSYRREFSRLVTIKDSYIDINKGYENLYQILTKIVEYKDPLMDNTPASQKTTIINRIVNGSLREILGKSIPSLYVDYNRDLFEKKMATFESIKTELSEKALLLEKYLISAIQIITTPSYPGSAAYLLVGATAAQRGGLQIEDDANTPNPDYTTKMDLAETVEGAALLRYPRAAVAGPEPFLAKNVRGCVRQAILYLKAAKNIYIRTAVVNFDNFKSNLMKCIKRIVNIMPLTGIFNPVFLTDQGNPQSPASGGAGLNPVPNLTPDRKKLIGLNNKPFIENIVNCANKLIEFVDSLKLDTPANRLLNNVNYPNAPAANQGAVINIVRINGNDLEPPMKFNGVFTTAGINNLDIAGNVAADFNLLNSDRSILLHADVVNTIIANGNRFFANKNTIKNFRDALNANVDRTIINAINSNIASIGRIRVKYNGNKSFNEIYTEIFTKLAAGTLNVFGVSNKTQSVNSVTEYTNYDRNIGGVFIQRVYFMFNILVFNPRFLYKFTDAIDGVNYDPVPKLVEIFMKILLRNTNIYKETQDDYIQQGLIDIENEIKLVNGLRKADGTAVNHKNDMLRVLKDFKQLYTNMFMDNTIKLGVFTGGEELMFQGGVDNNTANRILKKYANIISMMDINFTGKLFSCQSLYISALYKIMQEKFPQIPDADLLTLMGHFILYFNSDIFSPDYHRALVGIFGNLVENYNIRNTIDKCCNNLDYILEKFLGIGISIKGMEKRAFRRERHNNPANSVALAYNNNFPLEIIGNNQNYYLKSDNTFSNGGGNPPPNDPFNTVGNDVVNINNIIARAKNAIKYATIIYKSLHKVYTSIAEKPKYLGLAPYISDVYEIIGKEDTIAPLSFAVDVIPTICNTVKSTDESNILKRLEDNVNRKGLGLHCNNIFEIEKLFSEKSDLLEGVGMFLLDDKLHSITINDFPHFKSLLNMTGGSDIIRSNISQSTVNNYIADFGKLVKYLYEIDFKNMFANSFPVFNSVDNPKYFISTKSHYQLTFNEFGSQLVGKSLKNALPTILGYDSELFLKRNIGYEGSFLEIISLNSAFAPDNPLNGYQNKFINSDVLYNIIKDPKMLLTTLELRTNNKDILEYISYINEPKGQNSGIGDYKAANITNKSLIMMKNILDVGIMPININAMMREIPLANTINGVYSFDIIIDWLQKRFKESNVNRQVANGSFTPSEAQSFTTHSAFESQYYSSRYSEYLKNPLCARMIPINKSLAVHSTPYSSCFGNDIRGLPKGKVGLKAFDGIYNNANLFSKLLDNINVSQTEQTRYISNMEFDGNAALTKLNYDIKVKDEEKKYNIYQFGTPSSIFSLIDKLTELNSSTQEFVNANNKYRFIMAANNNDGRVFIEKVDALIAKNIASSVGNAIWYHFIGLGYATISNAGGVNSISQVPADRVGANQPTRSWHFSRLLKAGDLQAITELVAAHAALHGANNFNSPKLSLLVTILACTSGKTSAECIKYASFADLLILATPQDIFKAGLSQPVNYNYFPSFVDNQGYLLNSKLVDIGISHFSDKSKLVKHLVGELPENVDAAAPKYELKDSTYYSNQIPYEPTYTDLYCGVDPDLQMPVLGVNIYSDILLDLYQREFKYRYESPSKIYNPETFAKGMNSLYNMGPRQ